jgi:hypothetical protein
MKNSNLKVWARSAAFVALTSPCLLSTFQAAPSRAALIAYEPFDYADGDLRAEDGGEGQWTNPWHAGQGFGSGDAWQVTQPSLSYTDSGGRTLPTAGGAARADVDGLGDDEFREARPWDVDDHNDEGDVVWFSFLFNRTSGHTSGNHIWILGDAGLPDGIGVYINPTNIGARIQVAGVVHGGGGKSFTVGEDHLVVGRMTFSELMDDEVRFWLDPELNAIPQDDDPNSGAVTAALNQTRRTGFYMRQSNSPGVTAIDEIRIATDFFSAIGVPEPTSLVIIAAGFGLIVCSRKRTN